MTRLTKKQLVEINDILTTRCLLLRSAVDTVISYPGVSVPLKAFVLEISISDRNFKRILHDLRNTKDEA